MRANITSVAPTWWNVSGSSYGNTSNGSLYFFQTLTINATGTYQEIFNYTAQLAPGNWNVTVQNATGQNVSSLVNLTTGIVQWSGPPGNYSVVPNPYLGPSYLILNGTVLPSTGTNATLYSFIATVANYKSMPLTLTVTIDSTPHAVIQQSPSTWIYSSLLPTGIHSYWFSCTDGLNYSSIDNQTLVVFLGPSFGPLDGIAIPSTGSNHTVFRFILTADNLVGLNTSAVVTIENVSFNMTALTNSIWTYNTTLENGVWNYWFFYTDGLNYSSIDNQTVIVTPPNLFPIISDGQLTQSMLSNVFVVTSYDPEGQPLDVSIFIDGIPYNMTNIFGNIWSFNDSLSPGVHVYYFSSYDGIDATLTAPLTFSVLDYPPMINSSNIVPSYGGPNTAFTFYQYAYDPEGSSVTATVIIDGTAYPMVGGPLFSYPTHLATGSHSFYFTATDGVSTTQTQLSGITVITPQHTVQFTCSQDVTIDLFYVDMSFLQSLVIQGGHAQTILLEGSYFYVYHYLGNDSQAIPFEVLWDVNITIQVSGEPPVSEPSHGFSVSWFTASIIGAAAILIGIVIGLIIRKATKARAKAPKTPKTRKGNP